MEAKWSIGNDWGARKEDETKGFSKFSVVWLTFADFHKIPEGTSNDSVGL